MKVKFSGILTLLLAFIVQLSFAQESTISGQVTDADDGMPLAGVNIIVKNSSNGTQTDFDGNYSISANNGDVLVFSYVGYTSQEITSTGNSLNVSLVSGEALEEVVITALGISREKKSIGYSTQEISGEDVASVKVDNVVNSLSGKVSGVQIKANNNFGGSSNFLIRGVSSLTGNNQPLFVVDGIPLSNKVNNSSSQKGGGKGYDYGNAASDLNPDDIASLNILKGSAASVLYGSRAANGVVIITTKKGKSGSTKVNVTSGVTFGAVDKNTFIEYQDEYGAGYGPYYGSTGYFEDIDVDGDGNLDLAVPTYDDGSYGAPLDGSLVYQWDAFVPESDNYLKATPYVAGESTPIDFFETSLQLNNSVSVSGANDKFTYRLGYTNFQNKGMLPNSKLDKNSFNLNGTLKVNDKFRVGSAANFIAQQTTGRNSTGYSDNLMSQFRQWWQVNVNFADQKEIFDRTGLNYSWNHTATNGGDALSPQYWDNPYWTRYKNFQTDERNRFYGNAFATYSLTNWLDVTAKAAVDTYSELREERRAIGSVATGFGILDDDESSGYDRKDISFTENNYDLVFNVNTDLTEDLSLSGVAGINIRQEKYDYYRQSTAGGLIIPGLYALNNSKSSNPKPIENLQTKQVNGYYAQASFGYKNMLYLDLTDRYDISSALPEGNNAYNYFAASSSLLFSKLTNLDWLNFGKVRAGYAEVGNDLPANNVNPTYIVNNGFGGAALFSNPNLASNNQLVPERTKEIELGLETKLLDNRVGLDLTWYKKNTTNQLLDVAVTAATGSASKYVNAGELQNKGVELGLNINPVRTEKFNWDIGVNWSKNKNLVVELFEDQTNLELEDFQGGVTINATVGEPYGTIRGTGFVYNDNGDKVVNDSGYYLSQSDQVIGNVNPEWTGGITNRLSYKDFSLNFLIDIQKGGDVYSLDTHYGQGTGLPNYTAGLNELGNPVRDPITDGADSGGVLNEGVTESGEPNTVRADASYYGGAYYWGNSSRNPGALTVYDASYVKLRELSISYNMPVKKWFQDSFINSANIALTGRNLWIIDKNVPFADPESGLGAGNAQGYLVGSFPTLRTIGFNLNLEF